MKPNDYAEALREQYRGAGTYSALIDRFKRAGVDKPYSAGTWSRIVNGDEPNFKQMVQIAKLCGLPAPEPPLDVQAAGVEHWERVGDGAPRYGVLFDQPSSVKVRPSESAEVDVHLVTPRPRKEPVLDPAPRLVAAVRESAEIAREIGLLDMIGGNCE
jgi:hypothetical protein